MLRGRVNGYIVPRLSIKRSRRLRIIGTVALWSLIFLGILTIFPIISNANYAEATVIPSTTTISIDISHDEATVALSPTSASGSFAASTQEQEANFTVSTNNLTGYNLSIVNNSGSTQLTDTELGASLASIGSNISEATFSNAANTTYNNKWGYKPSKYNSQTNTNFYPSPTTSATTLNATTCANNTTSCPTNSDSYSIAIGARVNGATQAGTYENTFVLVAVGNSVPYQINYLDNFSGIATTQYYQESSNNATASGFTLYTGVPTMTDYTFAGWCDGTVSHTMFDNSTCTGTVYQPGDSYSFTSPTPSTTSIANLYAMWNAKTFDLVITGDSGLSSMTIKRGSTSGSTINGVKSGDVVTFSDLHYGESYYLYPIFNPGYRFDNWTKTDSTPSSALGSQYSENTYYVMGNGAGAITLASTKDYIQDFSSEMCQSLASSGNHAVIDKRDGNDYTVRYINGNCWMTQNLRYIGDTGSESGSMVMKANTSNIGADTTIEITDLNLGDNYALARIHDSRNNTTGVWYNYAAASALTITGSSTTNTQIYDVCPAGWRLPTTSEQATLTNYSDAYSPVTGGNWYQKQLVNTGRGYWWSSTSDAATTRYDLYWDSSNSSLNINSNRRNLGFYVRCIKKKVYYMQDITQTAKASIPIGTTVIMTDKRDNKEYTTRRMEDGSLWMTKNLAIGCSGSWSSYGSSISQKSLTSADSNITNSSSDPWTTPLYDLINHSNATSDYTDPAIACSETYGAWYNYAAASAGTITAYSNSSEQIYDICPKGWSLPTRNEFIGISSYMSGFSPAVGGIYSGNELKVTTTGKYWTATSYNAQARYDPSWDGSSLDTTYYNSRFGGVYIRCIFRGTRTIAGFNYMQDINPTIVSSTPNNETSTLRDSRDDQDYTVRKINGNVWMTRNLAIGCAGSGSTYSATVSQKTLTSALSNVSSNYSTPTALLENASTDTQTADYSRGRMQCGSTYGAWYNYYAASAGTISGTSNSTNATYDVCPKGWRMPTSTEFSNITGYLSAFNPVAGGRWNGGQRLDTDQGYWWASTSASSTARYRLLYESSSNALSVSSNYRYGGRQIRCIAKTS